GGHTGPYCSRYKSWRQETLLECRRPLPDTGRSTGEERNLVSVGPGRASAPHIPALFDSPLGPYTAVEAPIRSERAARSLLPVGRVRTPECRPVPFLELHSLWSQAAADQGWFVGPVPAECVRGW